MTRRFQVLRFPNWIRKALSLVETQVPANLFYQTDKNGPYAPIVNMIDTFQGGLGIGDPIICNTVVSIPAGPITQVVNLSTGVATNFASVADTPAGDPNFGYIIFALGINVSAAAAIRTPWLFMSPPIPFTNNIGILLSATPQPSIGFPLAMVDILKSDTPLFIPPGFVPCVYSFDAAAGENMTVQASLMRIPAGFKPY